MRFICIIILSLEKESKEAIAGLTLINTKVAMANSYEVSMINKDRIRKTTKAIFLTGYNDIQYCAVTDYTLHPEFDEETLNTIALLKLEYNETMFKWKPMEWPKDYANMYEHEGQIFVLGYTDRHKVLEQEMHRMKYVSLDDCQSFYKNEGLDSKWTAPMEYQCFRRMYSTEQCVIESGMALIVHHMGKWTLLGMSVLGPGCSLPARFIDFAQYIPWIDITIRPTRRIRPITYETTKPNYNKIILEKINDNSIVMRPYEGREVIYGKCDTIKGVIMYQEEGKFEALDYGMGIYGLSIWDRLYHNVTCAMLTVECIERSVKPFSTDFDIFQYDEDLQDLVKSIPIAKPMQTVGPKVVHTKEGLWINWFYMPKGNASVKSVVFKFHFYKLATIKLEIYGTRIPNPTTPTPTTTLSTKANNKTRSRRTYTPHRRTTTKSTKSTKGRK